MPWQLPQTTTKTGTVVALGTTDDVLVSTEVTLTSTGAGSPTILGTGSNHDVLVYGKVVHDMGSAIVVGDSTTADTGNKVSIAQTGRVVGLDAVVISGVTSELANDGLIKATGIAIVADGLFSNTSPGITITNTGLIIGGSAAFSRGTSDAGQTITLFNDGTIFGDYLGVTLNDVAARDSIINTGVMIGNVKLGAGDDNYNGSAGRVDGKVYAGNGNDTLLGGDDADTLYGDAGDDTLTGNDGNDYLLGGAGLDLMTGGKGDDLYRISDARAHIVEGQDGGIDRVSAAVSYRLNSAAWVERMQTTSAAGTKAIDLAGNEFAQKIVGNAGDNRLEGREGKDTLYGLGGKDSFVFNTAPQSNLNYDTIMDFNPADDRMIFSSAVFTGLTNASGAILDDEFRVNSTGRAEDASDRFIYDMSRGWVFYDPDGLGGVGTARFAVVTLGTALTRLDFVME